MSGHDTLTNHPSLTSEDMLPSPQGTSPGHGKDTANCHCGRISIELPHPPTKLNECRCSVCYRYGALWSYYPRDDVNILVNILPTPVVSDAAAAGQGSRARATGGTGLRSYLRSDGDGDIAFFFCDHCSCLMYWGPTEKGLEFLKKEAELKGSEADQPKVGVNSRMLRPSLLEGVELKIGKFQDFF